ncbi:MAG: FAD-binding oxidoreductase [Chloroflexi bacterium]|nr:FAD-binding oxidoreductase [Chloroflexota bacterium]
MQTADAVVVGCGVHGASTAFHLAARGLDVVIVEAKGLAAGATGKSSALVRMHYTVLEEAQLAWESWKYFTQWAELVGGTCDFVQTGFVRLVHRSQQDKLRQNVKEQAALGIDTQLVSADDLRQIDPGMVVDDIDVAAYEPLSGYADPNATCQSFLDAARGRGARYLGDTRVEAIVTTGGRAAGVRTADGLISSPIVVVAAGNGSRRLCGTLGLDLPVWPFYIKTAIFERPPDLTRHLTCIDGPNGAYFRPEGAHLTLAGGTSWEVRVDDPDTDSTTADLDFMADVGARLIHRYPAMARAVARRGDVGYDTMSADGHPIVGRLPGVDGAYLQTGMSGTGFKISPAVGRNLAELIVNGRWANVNLDSFSVERFATNAWIRGAHDYKDQDADDTAEPAYGV